MMRLSMNLNMEIEVPVTALRPPDGHLPRMAVMGATRSSSSRERRMFLFIDIIMGWAWVPGIKIIQRRIKHIK